MATTRCISSAVSGRKEISSALSSGLPTQKPLDGLLLHVRQTEEFFEWFDPAEDIDAFHAVKRGSEL